MLVTTRCYIQMEIESFQIHSTWEFQTFFEYIRESENVRPVPFKVFSLAWSKIFEVLIFCERKNYHSSVKDDTKFGPWLRLKAPIQISNHYHRFWHQKIWEGPKFEKSLEIRKIYKILKKKSSCESDFGSS